ncbi:aminotransferase class I/II-fold pyridoxal phosphate-dependent enzyme [Armatimonas sp.]|uniref:aminotransferase class I/II-fold pyridoxal phosphate-dependent enzyme n=1 Tax=Armatimonas sp. TaxID=1872638 RepID=UPI00374C9B3B
MSQSSMDVALGSNLLTFAVPSAHDMMERTERYYQWFQARTEVGIWPYERALHGPPGPVATVEDRQGGVQTGINFASQDYLSLTGHPTIREAALQAIHDFGPHSSGSGTLLGNTSSSYALERELSEFLQVPSLVLFPTGWGAGYGAVAGLIRPADHVVLDTRAHACIQQGAMAACRNVGRHEHLDLDDARRILAQIRGRDTKNAILVVTEGLFSMDADWPDILALQELCHEYSATLMVDVAHDLGAMGPGGTGLLGEQSMLGKVDIVMGAFSKTFASNGGFVASRLPGVTEYIRVYGNPHVFSNALSPMQTEVIRAALKIVRSEEGEALRQNLSRAVHALREGFASSGIPCLGKPSPIVPVPVGSEKVARLTSAELPKRGLFANLVEFPAVPVGQARFRMQVQAAHTPEQSHQAVHIMLEAIQAACARYEALA